MEASVWHMVGLCSLQLESFVVHLLNTFASTPVAATGFQTQATYYTCRSDGFTVPKRTLLSELIIVHKNIY